jgi:hypothetical protein
MNEKVAWAVFLTLTAMITFNFVVSVWAIVHH